MKLCPHCGHVYDRPEDDATDAAHPAWWRGHDHGSQKVAELLFRVCLEGATVGAHYAAPVAQVVLAIEALRSMSRAYEPRAASPMRPLEDIRDRVAMVKHHGAVFQTCVEDREHLLRMVDDQATTIAEWQNEAAKQLGRVIELEKLIDEVDDVLELTVDQLARMQPAWKAFAARAFGRWVARMAAEQQR